MAVRMRMHMHNGGTMYSWKELWVAVAWRNWACGVAYSVMLFNSIVCLLSRGPTGKCCGARTLCTVLQGIDVAPVAVQHSSQLALHVIPPTLAMPWIASCFDCSISRAMSLSPALKDGGCFLACDLRVTNTRACVLSVQQKTMGLPSGSRTTWSIPWFNTVCLWASEMMLMHFICTASPEVTVPCQRTASACR